MKRILLAVLAVGMMCDGAWAQENRDERTGRPRRRVNIFINPDLDVPQVVPQRPGTGGARTRVPGQAPRGTVGRQTPPGLTPLQQTPLRRTIPGAAPGRSSAPIVNDTNVPNQSNTGAVTPIPRRTLPPISIPLSDINSFNNANDRQVDVFVNPQSGAVGVFRSGPDPINPNDITVTRGVPTAQQLIDLGTNPAARDVNVVVGRQGQVAVLSGPGVGPDSGAIVIAPDRPIDESLIDPNGPFALREGGPVSLVDRGPDGLEIELDVDELLGEGEFGEAELLEEDEAEPEDEAAEPDRFEGRVIRQRLDKPRQAPEENPPTVDRRDRDARVIPDRWRYIQHNGEWWYRTPDNRWLFHRDGRWTLYNKATFQGPPKR